MKSSVKWVVGALIAVSAALAFTSLMKAPPQEAGGVATGQAAPDFSLPDYQSAQSIKLADYRGKVVLVNFWATWCPPCRQEIPDFVRIQQELRPRGFEIVGISLDAGGAQDVAPFAKEMGINYAIALGDQAVTTRYGGVRAIPTSFLLDREGKVVQTFTGAIPGETLKSSVEALL